MAPEKQRPAWGDMAQAGIVWLVGAVLIPLTLVVGVIAAKDVTFHKAVAGGELFVIGVGVAGASLALEMIVAADRLTITLYKSALLLALIANVGMYMGTLNAEAGHVLRDLEPAKITISVYLVAVASALGAWAPIRKVLADGSLR